jgi:hypothetical protein
MAIPGVKEEMAGMIGIDNGFQHQSGQCFAEGFNRTIGENFTSSDDAVVCRIRLALRIGLCFIVQSSLLLARRLCTKRVTVLLAVSFPPTVGVAPGLATLFDAVGLALAWPDLFRDVGVTVLFSISLRPTVGGTPGLAILFDAVGVLPG